MKTSTLSSILFIALSGAVFSGCAPAKQDSQTNVPKKAQVDEVKTGTAENTQVSAEANTQAFPDKLLWGDTHLHTSNSPDAFSFGARLTPADAYKFARGDEILTTAGHQAQLKKPLDFLVVADHAVGMGISNELYNGNPTLIGDPLAKKWHDMLNEGGAESGKVAKEMITAFSNKTLPKTMTDPSIIGPIHRSVWQRANGLADEYNAPGKFTALIGYEYTSMPNGNNLHRVVVFRDGKDKTNQVLPFSAMYSTNPEDLWAALAKYEDKTGGKVLAIPHNSNVSNGLMFAKTDFNGDAIDADYAKTRARWEPVVEVTQIKGDSESHPVLSPNDEFSGFGDVGWDLGNLSLQELKTEAMLGGDYTREALKRGLEFETTTGTNPYKFGLIGSTDSHTALATADEDNFYGKFVRDEPKKGRLNDVISLGSDQDVKRYSWQFLAGGYAGVWARDNTRGKIWDALKRKEVYGTTGPRMRVRFFGGSDFKTADANQANLASIGYAKGVPMGGDLSLTKGQAPQFLIAAIKDPDGANLDRVQIIKGWLGANGETHEKVYDVKWAGARAIKADGKLPAIGSSVNIKTGSYTNTIGASELSTVWQDPDFDAAQSAFYYVRVLEIPTPRWVLYDAVRYGSELPKDAHLTQQERAYTSPIWYKPK